MLARQPAYTAVVVVSLALGIALCSAAFSVVNGVLLRPLPLVGVGAAAWGITMVSAALRFDVRLRDFLVDMQMHAGGVEKAREAVGPFPPRLQVKWAF